MLPRRVESARLEIERSVPDRAEVSAKTTAASKVTMRRLTRRPTGANLAIPDLVRYSNPRMPKAAMKLGRTLSFDLPRAVWFPSKSIVWLCVACVEAPRLDARLRIEPPLRTMLAGRAAINMTPINVAPIADNLFTNSPAAARKDRCRITITRGPGGHKNL
jgi:hypothetical protein